jgi:hypothetical protein
MFGLAGRAHVGDAGRGAVEILAGHQVRDAARAHRRVGDPVLAHLLEQRHGLCAGERVVVGREHTHLGGQHQQADLLAEDAFDDVEARQHGGDRITDSAAAKALSATSAISIWRDTFAVAAVCSSPTIWRYWPSGLSFWRAPRRLERAEILRQRVARVGELVDHGLVEPTASGVVSWSAMRP